MYINLLCCLVTEQPIVLEGKSNGCAAFTFFWVIKLVLAFPSLEAVFFLLFLFSFGWISPCLVDGS